MKGKVRKDSAFNLNGRGKSKVIDFNPISKEEMGFSFALIEIGRGHNGFHLVP
jgi:hypothetical protein